MVTLPYDTEVIRPLKELFKQDDIAKIPSFNIKSNTDLHLISSNIRTEVSIENMQDTVDDKFSSISRYMNDNTNLARLQNIEYISKEFASSIENNFHFITNEIGKQVTSLKDEILARYTLLMSRDAYEKLISDDIEVSENDYQYANWLGLKSPVKQAEIIDTACANANCAKSELSSLNLAYISKKLNHQSEYMKIDITPTSKDMIIGRLNNAFSNDDTITLEHVTSFVSMISNVDSYNKYTHRLSSIMSEPNKVTDNSLSVNIDTYAYQKLVDNFGRIVSGELNDQTFNSLIKNIDVFNKTLIGAQYWLLFNKNIKFKNKLILSKNVLNRPVYEEYVQSGKNISFIHNYIKAIHGDKPIPNTGIDVDTVKSTDVSEKLEIALAKQRANETFIKSKCLAEAYSYVMNNFSKSAISDNKYSSLKKPGEANRLHSSIKLKASILGGNTAQLDSVLYDIILGLYNRPSISKMCKYLDNSFKTLASANEDITGDSILASQCDAVIEMIVDHLFDTVVEK